MVSAPPTGPLETCPLDYAPMRDILQQKRAYARVPTVAIRHNQDMQLDRRGARRACEFLAKRSEEARIVARTLRVREEMPIQVTTEWTAYPQIFTHTECASYYDGSHIKISQALRVRATMTGRTSKFHRLSVCELL